MNKAYFQTVSRLLYTAATCWLACYFNNEGKGGYKQLSKKGVNRAKKGVNRAKIGVNKSDIIMAGMSGLKLQ